MNENKELTINNGYLTNLNLENNLSNELAGLDSGFERIKIPAGGSLNFEIPNLENSDEPTFTKEFSAVILYHHPLFTMKTNIMVAVIHQTVAVLMVLSAQELREESADIAN